MTMGAQDSFTIDELAAAAGMTPRNVRAYRTKGLLFPPIRVGRTSQYRIAHLHRLRDIRQLREAGLPLKMIIEAANRGEDLGPNGALWLAAGRAVQAGSGGAESSTPSTYVEDPQAYAIMQTLTGRGLTPSTVLLVALQAARASSTLATEIDELLSTAAEPASGPGSAPPPGNASPPVPAEVIDLATVITREMLGANRSRSSAG
jgi:DNA-binding transcriptional MerR regulator